MLSRWEALDWLPLFMLGPGSSFQKVTKQGQTKTDKDYAGVLTEGHYTLAMCHYTCALPEGALIRILLLVENAGHEERESVHKVPKQAPRRVPSGAHADGLQHALQTRK